MHDILAEFAKPSLIQTPSKFAKCSFPNEVFGPAKSAADGDCKLLYLIVNRPGEKDGLS